MYQGVVPGGYEEVSTLLAITSFHCRRRRSVCLKVVVVVVVAAVTVVR